MARVSIKGVDTLKKRFNDIANIELRDAVNKATQLVHGQAKALCPSDTGLLRESIHMSVKSVGNELQGRVYTNTEYAAYVEFGTGVKGNGTYPYSVKGLSLEYKDKGWAYYDEDKGEWIYTKGQKAQPYMYPALHRHKKTIEGILKQGVKTKLKENCKGD